MSFTKKILVTGGLGFIGSNFLNEIVKNFPNYLFVNFDLKTEVADERNVHDEIKALPNYVFVRGDISIREDVDEVFFKYSITDVVHFAAESHVDKSIVNPNIFVKTNVGGTLNLLSSFYDNTDAYSRGIFLHVSTDEVYGHAEDPERRFTEDSPLEPRNIYSATKASAEHLVHAFGNTFGIRYVIVRPSNNYGPNQDLTKFIPKMVDAALNDRPLQVYGDGKNFRQWIHVKDTCWAIWNLMNEGVIGETYNIGGSEIFTNNEVARMIIEATKSQSEIRYIEDRAGHDRGYSISSEKTKKHINFDSSISFLGGGLQGVIDYVKNRQ